METTKARLGVLIITAALAVNMQAQTFLTNGLVAYYPFYGDAHDASGNGNNGSANGVSYGVDRFGVQSSAAIFSGQPGTNSIVVCPPTLASIAYFPITYSCWFRLDGSTVADGEVMPLLGREEACQCQQGALVLLSSQNLGFTNELCYMVNRSEFFHLNSFSPATNRWYHAVLTVDTNAVMSLFVNGSLFGTMQSSMSALNGSLGLSFSIGAGSVEPGPGDEFGPGGHDGPPLNCWSGAIDDVRIYNRALSTNEVLGLYQYESQPASAPVITAQPQSLNVNAHADASFSVGATGALPLGYQWSFNGTNISGATSSSLSITNVTPASLGVYAVTVSHEAASTTSSDAVLSMYPFLATPFTGLITDWGFTNTLSVAAWGTGPLSYQWFNNGVVIPDATNQTLVLSSIQFTNAGLYSVVVTSPLGSVTNVPAQVVVNPAGSSLGLYPGVTVSGVVGYTYSIQANTDLTNTNGWSTVAALTLTEPVQLWVDVNVNASSPTNQRRFYRVVPGP